MVLVNRLSDEPDGVISVLSGNSISFKVLLAICDFSCNWQQKCCMLQVACCKKNHIDHGATCDFFFFPVMGIGKKIETLLLLAATCIMRCFFKDKICCKLWEKSANFYSLASLCIGTSRDTLVKNSGAYLVASTREQNMAQRFKGADTSLSLCPCVHEIIFHIK